MKVIINGEADEVPADITLQNLLDTLGLSTRGIAVERNLEIVPRAEYAECRLCEGDQLEIVTLAGGG